MIDVKNRSTKPRRGRPPAFDRDTVLARAAGTFWRMGYEGASIGELTAAMGISAQSLYAAFGSKAALYDEALDWYGTTAGSLSAEALAAPDAIATIARLLRRDARRFADAGSPAGCMIATALLGCGREHDAVARGVAARREATVALVRRRLDLAQADRELAPSADPAALARFVGAIVQGMSVQARDGASAADLLAVADLAVTTLEAQRA